MITRSDIAGALKLIHANNLTNRRGHIQNMLAVEHPPEHVAKVLNDLESYEGWSSRTDLDTASAPVGAVPAKNRRSVATGNRRKA